MASAYMRNLRGAYGQGLILMPSVASIIRDSRGAVLMQRKAGGVWSLPAGAIEPGEAPEAALQREVREETGLIVTSQSLVAAFGGTAFRYVYANGDCVEYTVLVYRCEARPGGPPSDSETVGLSYFLRAEAPPLALPYPQDLLFVT